MFRAALLRASVGVAALVAGIVISIVGESSTVLFVVGTAVTGLSAVALASLFFYEVGRSEDRERERRRAP